MSFVQIDARSEQSLPAPSEVMALRVPEEQFDPSDELLEGMTPGDFEYFQRWGYRKLAMQMIMGEAKTLAGDPELATPEGRRSHEWVSKGNEGLLPFNTCMAWLGLYDLQGQYLDEAARERLLSDPGEFLRALKQCEGLLDFTEANEVGDAAADTVGPSMSISDRINLVYADEDLVIGFDGGGAGAPIFMGFEGMGQGYAERPCWRAG